jgi:hypothetical protein
METEVVQVIRYVVQYTQRFLDNGTLIRYAHNCGHDASFSVMLCISTYFILLHLYNSLSRLIL